jgi:hypothetical protein
MVAGEHSDVIEGIVSASRERRIAESEGRDRWDRSGRVESAMNARQVAEAQGRSALDAWVAIIG